MRNNETGEFELIVGNRQLLSGFFIVVLLFAVAFAMGYVVGQNSPRSAKVATEAASASPPVNDARPAPLPAAPAPAPPGPAGEASGPTGPSGESAPPQPTTQAAREPESTPSNPAPAANAAAPGSYWQVMAVAQPDAEVIMKT